MSLTYHILNGDMLLHQLPKDISGEIIICREALVDGVVKAHSLNQLFELRAAYLNHYVETEHVKIDYFKDVVSEFEKISTLPENATTHLWFEFDLFCQVNLWFVISLLKNQTVYLVLPNSEFGFGNMNSEDLKQSLANKIAVSSSELATLKGLWPAFQSADQSKIEALAAAHRKTLPFLLTAAKANERRINGDLTNAVKRILLDTNKPDLQEAFEQFCSQEPTFGYSDLQFKRIYDQLISCH